MARAARSIATSGSPRNAFAKALKCHAQAKFGLSASDAINKRDTIFYFTHNDDERNPRGAERHRIVSPEVGGAPRQPFRLGNLTLAIGHPAEPYALQVAPRGHAIGRSVVGIDFDRASKQRHRLFIGRLC